MKKRTKRTDILDYRVSVFDYSLPTIYKKEIIARVRYNNILDYWNGTDWCNGRLGTHKGLTKLKDGRYVLIEGSDYEGDKDTAYVISKEEALKQILRSGNLDLLKLKKWKELNDLYLDPYSDKKYEDLDNLEEN